MATSVQVLCPNGRRQTVKVTANTKLLQVLEEVCTKQGFLPCDDYDLIHGRKTVDLTLAFRFSNLPNNVKLELVKSTNPRRQEGGEVTIALQLESGERLQHAFDCKLSLWEILLHWEGKETKYKGQLTRMDSSQSPPVHPVCIYMTEEVVGEDALRYMTLKKLALTSGKAIIRLFHRPVDDSTLAEITDKMEKEKARLARLELRAAELSESSSTNVSQPPTPVYPPASVQPSAVENMDVDTPTQSVCSILWPPWGTREEKRKGTSRELLNPEEMDTQENRAAQSQASSVDLPCGGASAAGAGGTSGVEQLRRMNLPGVEIITPDDFHQLTPEEQQMARRLMHQFAPGISRQQQQSPPQPSFANFKFPEETKGKDLYHNELSDVQVEEFKPCDREAVIFDSNEENTSKAMELEPCEDFFQVTEADVRSLYKDLQRLVSQEKALMTEGMRQMELEDKYQQYEHVIVRVQFPDGLVLQGCFRPRETVYTLHKFVRECLQDKAQDFQLYRTPPKQVLTDAAQTLVQADLVPASLVYFSSKKTEEHSLSSSARQEMCTKRRADQLSVRKLAKKQMEAQPSEAGNSNHSAAGSSSRNMAATTSSGSRPAQKTASSSSSEAKVPKWLKMGKK